MTERRKRIMRTIGLLLAIVYTSYLHYKILVYHRVIGDLFAINGYSQMKVLEALKKDEPEKAKETLQQGIAVTWSAFYNEGGLARKHSGRDAWLFRLERFSAKYGDKDFPFPAEMKASMQTVNARSEPERPRVDPMFWSYPAVDWWP